MIVLNDLLDYNGYKIYQDTEMFCFSLDSVLLANFVTINKKVSNILDIGCGNAVIPLILSTRTNASITGVEIQKDVFKLAVKSVNYNKCDRQIKIINGDINELYKNIESDSFDTITCNPPYFKINEFTKQNLSSYKRIARHEIHLDIEKVCLIAKKLLKNNGNIAIVHRTNRLIEIIENMKKNNIEPKKIQFIYPKESSESNLVLIEGIKNGRAGLKLLPPLYVHNNDGSYTEIINKMFKSKEE